MQLPGRLRATSLGDILGALHRAAASGALELLEARGRLHRIHWTNGQVSAVELDGVDASLAERLRESGVSEDILRRSLLRALASRRLHGDVLVNDFQIDAHAVMKALHAQVRSRLEVLDRLDDAQLFFRVQLRPPRGVLSDRPLPPETFLYGRSRARDRHWREARVEPRDPRTARTTSHGPGSATGGTGAASAANAANGTGAASSGRYVAAKVTSYAVATPAEVLGVAETASMVEVKRAYRCAVRTCHPDLHPHVTNDERAALVRRFRDVTEAYRALEASLA